MHHNIFGQAIGVILVLALASAGAHAATLRYATVARGDVTIAGNTLGLAKQANANGPGTRDSIGTFITTSDAAADNVPANPGNPWPAGTTNQWQLSGSTSALALPFGSTVLYTELIWGGSHAYGPENVGARRPGNAVRHGQLTECRIALATAGNPADNFFASRINDAL